MVRLVRWVCTWLVVLSVAGCVNVTGEWSQDEVARISDPSGAVDAVLFERNGGATTSFGYGVYVVPRGRPVNPAADSTVASLYAAVRSDSAYGVNIRWTGSDELAVEYLSARTAALRDSLVTIGQHAVRITLRPGVADPRAPGGGMLYNLRDRSR